MTHEFKVVDNKLTIFPSLTGEEDNLLGLSIQKWEEIVKFLEFGDVIHDGGNEETCALCAKYLHVRSGGGKKCVGCPVSNATERHYCYGTPYDIWQNAWHMDNFSLMLCAAKDMVEFLKSLEEGVGR